VSRSLPQPAWLLSRLGRRVLRRLPKRWKRLRRAAQRVLDMRFRRTYAHTIAHVPSRDELPALLNRRGLVGTGAEIGVKNGKYSDYLLSRWRGVKLISVDPWLADEPDAYIDRANVAQSDHERFFAETKRRLARHGARSEIWRMTSVEAAVRVADDSLDFAYIDARHDSASVLEDLHAWFPKVRPGGILAGHDYVDGTFPSGVFGVRSAVDAFLGERGIPVHSTRGRRPVEMFPSWLAVVPAAAAPGSAGPAARSQRVAGSRG
jgi:Methyltransferase domain